MNARKLIFNTPHGRTFNEQSIDISHMTLYAQRQLLSILRSGQYLSGKTYMYQHSGKTFAHTYDKSGRLV